MTLNNTGFTVNGVSVKLHESPALCEKYYSFVHKSGLKIYVWPKDFSTSYAIFATKYGSIDNEFAQEGEDLKKVPAGIAHFLEHKMFDCPDGSDASQKLSALGAYANAFTSYDKTSYLFSCTENEYEALSILLDFVSVPYFTNKTVEKEQGIIAQEIRMYEDNPGSRLNQGLLSAMYENHGIREEIAGSVESIAEINKDLLYKCHNTFYNLNNMGLFLCGKFELERVIEVCDRILKPSCPFKVKKGTYTEKASVYKDSYTAEMEVATPFVAIGVKDIQISDDPHLRIKKCAELEIMTELLFSKSSPFFTKLYENGLIKGDMGYWYEHCKNFSLISINGETDDPKAFYDEFLSFIEETQSKGISEEDFERCKRVAYSSSVKSFDSTESIANSLLNCVFDDCDLFEFTDCVANAKPCDIEKLINDMFKTQYYSLSQILPLKEDAKNA